MPNESDDEGYDGSSFFGDTWRGWPLVVGSEGRDEFPKVGEGSVFTGEK